MYCGKSSNSITQAVDRHGGSTVIPTQLRSSSLSAYAEEGCGHVDPDELRDPLVPGTAHGSGFRNLALLRHLRSSKSQLAAEGENQGDE